MVDNGKMGILREEKYINHITVEDHLFLKGTLLHHCIERTWAKGEEESRKYVREQMLEGHL